MPIFQRSNNFEYSEWTLIRQLDPATFAPDPDWQATQPQTPTLQDGNGDPVRGFCVPSLVGDPARGLKLMIVGVDANDSPVPPGGATLAMDLLEVLEYSGNNDMREIFVSTISQLFGVVNGAGPIEQGTINFNQVTRQGAITGGKAKYVTRITALNAPAGAEKVFIFVAPQGQ